MLILYRGYIMAMTVKEIEEAIHDCSLRCEEIFKEKLKSDAERHKLYNKRNLEGTLTQAEEQFIEGRCKYEDNLMDELNCMTTLRDTYKLALKSVRCK